MADMAGERAVDFRSGSSWGRALHGHTFHSVNGGWLDKIGDWLHGVYRASVMVHYPRSPRVGETVLWSAKSGTVAATIYRVDRCRDPEDMYTLFVRIPKAKP